MSSCSKCFLRRNLFCARLWQLFIVYRTAAMIKLGKTTAAAATTATTSSTKQQRTSSTTITTASTTPTPTTPATLVSSQPPTTRSIANRNDYDGTDYPEARLERVPTNYQDDSSGISLIVAFGRGGGGDGTSRCCPRRVPRRWCTPRPRR